MDLYQIIEELIRERNRIHAIIEFLERASSTEDIPVRAPGKRRGRKSMDQAARQEVSDRMKSYWAKRHAKADGDGQVKSARA